MMLRAATCLISLALHALFASPVVLPLLFPTNKVSLKSGEGEDTFTVEQGIAIEGLAKLGDSQFAAEALEAEPAQASEARPEIEEVKAKEEVEETQIVTSSEGPSQDIPEVKPVPLEQPRPAQVATLEQVEQLKVEELQSSGEEKRADKSTEKSQYLGKLRYHLEAKKVNPRSQLSGQVVIQFEVDSTGAVISRLVTSSSGSKVLDDAAIASIDRATPFPPMPEVLSGETIVVSVPFRFSVR